MSQPIKYSELWDRLEPFAQTMINNLMLQGKSGKGALNEPYAIILYKATAQVLRFYSVTTDGLNAAKAAAEVGDIIFLPAGTIVLSGGTGYTYGDEISTGAITVTSETGHEISGLTIGNWYAIESFNGYWKPGSAFTQTCSIFALSNGGGFTGAVGLNQDIEVVNLPSFCAHGEVFVGGDSKTYGRVYFQATTTSVFVRVADTPGYFGDNTGTLSWRLRSASLTGGILEIDAGIEIVGLGENSVLDGSLINNGILTNLKVTGTISGSGDERLVSNPLEQLFSRIIKSSVQPGNPPFTVVSETVVDNLNVDLLDGYHASEFVRGVSSAEIGSRVTVLDDTDHNGMPGLCRLANGNLLYLYRAGTTHSSDKGSIKSLTSTDNGATWGSGATVYTDATYDVRDPNITCLSSGRLIVSFFKYDYSTPATLVDGVYVTYSDDAGATWETPVQITASSFTAQVQSSAPVVEMSNGDLLLPIYGKDTGDTYTSARLVKSTDSGVTWSEFGTIVESGTRHHHEPNIVRFNNDILMCVTRSDTPSAAAGSFYRSYSYDSGATWTTEAEIFAATGSPRMLVASNAIIIVYRENTTDSYHTVYRLSTDRGATWGAETDLDTEDTYMTYAAMVEYSSGFIGIAYGVEDSGQTEGNLYFQKLLISGLATVDHNHGSEYAAASHAHTESDITDLDHDAVKLQGRALANTAPTDGQTIVWDNAGSTWKPGTVTGGAAMNVQEVDGTPSVNNVTVIKVTNGSLTDEGGGTVTLDFGSAATDGAAIHDNVAGEISAITEKTSLADNDLFIIEDSADANNKKRVKKSNLGISGGYTQGARVYNNANVTIGNNAAAAVTFNSEEWDTDNCHSTSSNTSRLTATTAGKYLVIGQAWFVANSTGYRVVYIYKNGSSICQVSNTAPHATLSAVFNISTIVDLAAGDYVELFAYQNSGGNLDIRYIAGNSPIFMMQKIG